MNILVTGANGQLGREIRLVSEGSPDRCFFSDINDIPGVETLRLDITDAGAVSEFVRSRGIGVIVNCAAYTDVERAETDIDLCRRLNATAPKNLAAAALSSNALLVHISTDYVFGGDPYNTPCREDRKGTPTGVYGQTKLEGEEYIMSSGCKYVIIRTSWLYSEYGRNFVKTMLSLTSTKPSLNVVFDQTGTPTYALDLACAIAAVIDDYRPESSSAQYGRTGIYHYSNEGVCSWYDFARMIAWLSGRTGCDIRPCHSDEYPSPVKRPAYSVLDKTKIRETFGLRIPYWTDSLRRCLANMGAALPEPPAGHESPTGCGR